MNILIVNVHSALNLGDDGIMRATLGSLTSAFPEGKITVAANDPDSWRAFEAINIVGSLTSWVAYLENGRWHARVALAPIYLLWLTTAAAAYRLLGVRLKAGDRDKRRLLSAYYAADCVLSCGGGNFYAHRSFSPFFIWAILTLGFAVAIGKKVILLPQSIGPIQGRFQRFMARFILSRAELIMTRERSSLHFVVNELEIHQKAIVVPDLAFSLPPVPAPTEPNMGREKSLRIGVTVIDRAAQVRNFQSQESYENALTALLLRLNKEYEAEFYIFAQCYGPGRDHDDRRAARRLFSRVKEATGKVMMVSDFQNALEAKAAYMGMDCVIATRMHSGVFALSSYVPTVLIGYQPKACGMMRMLELEQYCCDIETLTADQLYELVREVLRNRVEISQHIADRYIQIRKQLQGWTDYLVKV
ncbi:MAG: polysaccharide pyruvyl transferase family protein [Anaerolineales bacterium]